MKQIIIQIATCYTAIAFSSDQPKPLAAPNGRFVFGQISDFRRDQFMLDTQTGRLWQIILGQDSQTVLTQVPYQSVDVKGREVLRVWSDLPTKPEVISFPIPKQEADQAEEKKFIPILER